VTAAYEVLSDPEKRRIVDLGGDPLSTGAGAPGSSGNPFAGFGGFGDVFEAFFGGGATSRGPRPRRRQGADALLQLDLTLAEAAFGARKDITVETAVLCSTCSGSGCAPGTSPRTCPICGGTGEVQSVQRSFLGQVMTSRPCSACGGTGQQIPSPCPTCGAEGRVRTRLTVTVEVPAGIEDGMRIRLSGRASRTRRWPGRRPLHRGWPSSRRTFTLRIGHYDQRCHDSGARRTDLVLTTLDGEEADIRAGTPEPGADARGRGVHGCAAAVGETCSCMSRCARRLVSTTRRRSCFVSSRRSARRRLR
jgi:molecular chaperone DnaJ